MKKILFMIVAVLLVSTVNAQSDSVSLANQENSPKTRKKSASYSVAAVQRVCRTSVC